MKSRLMYCCSVFEHMHPNVQLCETRVFVPTLWQHLLFTHVSNFFHLTKLQYICPCTTWHLCYSYFKRTFRNNMVKLRMHPKLEQNVLNEFSFNLIKTTGRTVLPHKTSSLKYAVLFLEGLFDFVFLHSVLCIECVFQLFFI